MLKKEIINLFYDKHLKRKEISEKLAISPTYVTKIIKRDSRYFQEKEYRKNFHKHKKMTGHKKLIKNQREHNTGKLKIITLLFNLSTIKLLMNYQNQVI